MRILFISLIFLFSSHYALAQGHGMYCNQSESTADTQACLKKHLDTAQTRLNKIYEQLEKSLAEEKRPDLKGLQQTWLRYRDAECMWEATQTDTTPLKRINELSCMARLTDDRADILTVVYDDTSLVSGRKEFGSFPRWMNVVAKDHPETAWKYGSRESFDLNCDDEDEKIITGFQTEEVKTKDDLNQNYFTKKVALAVVKNPITGRPQSQIFSFFVNSETSPENICSDDISISVGEEKPTEISEDSSEEKEGCYTYLQVTAKGCEPKKIHWTGKNFEIAIEEATQKVNEKK